MGAIPEGVEEQTFAGIRAQIHVIGRDVITKHAAEVDADARFPHEAFVALREAGLMSAYVPVNIGGGGLNMTQVASLCEALGEYCASTAMVYAMHQIQVASIVHHCADSAFLRGYLRQLCDRQLLFASATTEIGVGGDLTSSRCALEAADGKVRLEKQAPVISYAMHADAILATCRKAPDAAASDQVLVVLQREQLQLSQTSGWDTLGFRGTCSMGFELTAEVDEHQILPQPFGRILSRTMHPFSHMVWGSLWLGLASSAVQRARKAVRIQARRNPEATQLSGLRLAEVGEMLFGMRAGLERTMARYQQLLDSGDEAGFEDFGFAIAINNTKIRCSELVVDIVGKALMIVGISGYRNDSKLSLSRQLRDAYGAALMVNNDRIRRHNATMQIVAR